MHHIHESRVLILLKKQVIEMYKNFEMTHWNIQEHKNRADMQGQRRCDVSQDFKKSTLNEE